VAVVVGLAGMKSKFEFMLIAGAAAGATGKLQAANKNTNKVRAVKCLVRIDWSIIFS
jgi:hypothetical protein